jgi:hypothetical protein
MGCRFNDFLKAPSWTLEFKQCTLEKKSISGNFKLCCAANAFLGQRHRRPSGLDVLGRGRSKNGEAKGGGNERVEGVKEEGKNGSSLPNDLMQKQQECCSLPF